ncbi:AraC family transcriptional regulator [Paenibacillus sp. FSL R5-0341]|uniref:helix-turn-helix transcriptional regulator n=1 Tax=Paenibacillus sp. FSL R5-0341 TaxID=2921636 RepID=UPI0030D085A0
MQSKVSETWYAIQNKEDQRCALAARLNTFYQSSSAERIIHIPEEIGQGYWQLNRIHPSMELVYSDAIFHRPTALSSLEQDDSIKLSFCIGESISWNIDGKLGEFHVHNQESSAYGSRYTSSTCEFGLQQHFKGFTLKLDQTPISGMMQQLPIQQLMTAIAGSGGGFYNAKMTPTMIRIVNEMTQCPYSGELKQLYLNGKALELLAVYFSECILERQLPAKHSGLSRTDLTSLQQAKHILDANLAHPPTLEGLSRQVCLNEFKLKKGFKQLFGLPVHAYVIEQRLEAAYYLLETRQMNVTTAAAAVGFNKTSHFSAQFKRKYGMTPSTYFNQTF